LMYLFEGDSIHRVPDGASVVYFAM
jgi:hypothetical protein